MQTTATAVSMTEEEYIQFELKSDIRHEYVNGQLIDMPGEYLKNNRIARRLSVILSLALNDAIYNIFTHDAKLKIPNEKSYFYPDLFVTDELLDEEQYIAYSAILVAEVLSKSTRAYDVFDKLMKYKKIPQLQYCLMIEPFKKTVDLHLKNDRGEWFIESFRDPDEVIKLPALHVNFKLLDLYK